MTGDSPQKRVPPPPKLNREVDLIRAAFQQRLTAGTWDNSRLAIADADQTRIRDKMQAVVQSARESFGTPPPKESDVWALICQVAAVPPVDHVAFYDILRLLRSPLSPEQHKRNAELMFFNAMSGAVSGLGASADTPSDAFFCAEQLHMQTLEHPNGGVRAWRIPQTRGDTITSGTKQALFAADNRKYVVQDNNNQHEGCLSTQQAARLATTRVQPLRRALDHTGHALFLEQHPGSGGGVSVNDPNVSSLQRFETFLARELDPDAKQTPKQTTTGGWCQTWSWFELETNIMGVSRLHQELRDTFKAWSVVGNRSNRVITGPIPHSVECMITAMNTLQLRPFHTFFEFDKELYVRAREELHTVSWYAPFTTPEPTSIEEPSESRLHQVSPPNGFHNGPGLSLSFLVNQLAIRYNKIISHPYSGQWPKLIPYRRAQLGPYCRDNQTRDIVFTAAYGLYAQAHILDAAC